MRRPKTALQSCRISRFRFDDLAVVVIVIVGLFTRRVPALGAKIVIVFHVIVYGLAKFVFDELVTIHFLHLYAILFVVEVAIMLALGRLAPRPTAWSHARRDLIDMTPWHFAAPLAFTLFSAVVFLYLVFSKLGLVGGLSGLFGVLSLALLAVNVLFWWRYLYTHRGAEAAK